MGLPSACGRMVPTTVSRISLLRLPGQTAGNSLRNPPLPKTKKAGFRKEQDAFRFCVRMWRGGGGQDSAYLSDKHLTFFSQQFGWKAFRKFMRVDGPEKVKLKMRTPLPGLASMLSFAARSVIPERPKSRKHCDHEPELQTPFDNMSPGKQRISSSDRSP